MAEAIHYLAPGGLMFQGLRVFFHRIVSTHAEPRRILLPLRELATPELPACSSDITAFYRLFLNREPDEPGFRTLTQLVEGGISIRKLACLLQDSTEALQFKSRQEATDLEQIDLPGFSMLALPTWNAISVELSTTKNYEPHISEHLKRMIEPDMLFVDIGANIGFYSMLAASLGARVEAFEPHSRNVWFLKKNAELNKFDINIHPIALADSDRLFLYSPLGGNGQLSEIQEVLPAAEQQLIRARSLDDVLDGKRPSIIKIDVEGAEGLVMRGAQASLDARPIVFSEFSAAAMNAGPVSARDYLKMFTSRQYQLSICRRDGSQEKVGAPDLERASIESATSFVDFVATSS